MCNNSLFYTFFSYRMLAYRCEDINKRLEPQELFARKELEQTIQLDVSAVRHVCAVNSSDYWPYFFEIA